MPGSANFEMLKKIHIHKKQQLLAGFTTKQGMP